jgi:hypothetical protein
MKVNVPGGSSIEEMASALRDKPDVLHKMPMIPNYGNASITNGDKETLEKAKVALNCSSCEQVFVKVLCGGKYLQNIAHVEHIYIYLRTPPAHPPTYTIHMF